ncbi:MAG: GNAT family N-acyltransferase [Patescibacteria group bacterium]
MIIFPWVKKIRREIEFWWFYKSFYQKFTFYTTKNPDELDELHRLRYQVYIEEYKYIDKNLSENGREKDNWDSFSVHFVIRDLKKEIAATVRLILDSPNGFPIEKHFNIDINVNNYQRNESAEISRLIVAKEFRRHHLMLVLIKGIFLYVKKHNIKNIFSVMDERLLPVVLKIGIPFKKIGQPSLYQGLTFPCILSVKDFEVSLQRNNPRLFMYLQDATIKFDEQKKGYSIS